jgi:CHAT domain-containing protein/Tfp pilus assembly protein PilF
MRILFIPLLLALVTCLALGQESRPSNDVQALGLRKPIEKEMRTGQVHNYGVSVTAAQVLDVVVEQRGIDVVVDVWAPDGKKIMEVDSPNGADGPEPVLLIAEATGIYVLQVRALEKDALGHYTITFKDQRTPNAQDLKHFDDLEKLAEAQRVENQWYSLFNIGHYAEAIPLAERVLVIREGVLGPNHPDVAVTLNSLAVLYKDTSDFARAESLFRRSLSIDEKVFGKDHPNLAITYGNLATLYFDTGDYGQSELLMKKALELREKSFTRNHPDVALSLHNLARIYQAKGDYARAEQLTQEALEIYRKVRSAEHPDIARSLGALAELYRVRGDFTHAEPLYQQALVIYQKLGSRGEFSAATIKSDLATLYQDLSSYEKAEQLYSEALLTYENALGKEHPSVAQVLNNLAEVYDSKGEYDRAEELHRRAQAIRKKLLGTESAEYAETLTNLGQLNWNRHNYEEAKSLSQQAILIWEKTLGKDHPYVARAYSNLAAAQGETKDLTGAVSSLKRVNEIEEHNLKLILITGSEDQKQIYLNTLSGNADYTVSLNVRYAPNNEQASKLALTSILQRKGRALDAMSDQIGNLRRRASVEDGGLLDQIEKVRSRLATLQISGGGKLKPEVRAVEITKLQTENEQLEARIGRHSEEFRVESQTIDIESVRRALPAGSVLLEFVLFRAFDLENKKVIGEQYAAYVLSPESSAPLLVSLGDASSIDDQIQRWRLALSDPKRLDVKDLGRSLDEKVMKPVRRLLGSARHVFVSTDGALNLIPFAALVNEKNHYLVEDYAITYLTSGRDLLRLQSPRSVQTSSVTILADPLFDLAASSQGNGSIASASAALPVNLKKLSRRSADFSALDYQPLLGTAAEAKALKLLWPSATIWTEEQATEAALKRVKSPRILHIATHGFFLPNKQRQEKAPGSFGAPDSLPTQESPLLRSGLILAGVKQQVSGEGEDGVLTALEASGMNLWGTKLVVLSACQTGLGDVKRGEGLYGLRRALVLAGSESQVISLWKVSDSGTRDLMTAYYTRMQNGEGRTEALREVQMAMLRGKLTVKLASQGGQRETIDVGEKRLGKDYRHPYYWAAFIQSGDWRNLDGK